MFLKEAIRMLVVVFVAFMVLFIITQSGCNDCDVVPDANLSVDADRGDAETCFRPNGGECIIDASIDAGGPDAEGF